MPGSVLRRTLADLRRGFAWWAVGLAGYVALIVSVYPTVRDNDQMAQLVEQYPEALKAFFAFGGQLDFTSAAGYLGGELFSFMIPLLFLVAAVGNGASSIAGEEERGTLDLLLAQPVTRRRVAIEKLVAMAAEVAGLGAVLWVALWVGARAFSLEISGANLAAATTGAALLAIAYGAIAFLLGAGTGRKGLAVGISIAAAVAAYLVSSLATLVDALVPLQKASPFYHYATSDSLREGLAPAHALVLVAVAVAAAVAGVWLFERRDVAA